MNTERTIVLENVGDCPIVLADVQSRMYSLSKGMKMRISAVVLQDILDNPASKKIFNMGYAKIKNITKTELYNMGLTEEEIEDFLEEEAKEGKEDEAKPVEKKEEPVKDNVKVAAKKSSTKKTTAAKTK